MFRLNFSNLGARGGVPRKVHEWLGTLTGVDISIAKDGTRRFSVTTRLRGSVVIDDIGPNSSPWSDGESEDEGVEDEDWGVEGDDLVEASYETEYEDVLAARLSGSAPRPSCAPAVRVLAVEKEFEGLRPRRGSLKIIRNIIFVQNHWF